MRDRARTIEGDALRIESEMKRLGVDAPREWLAMAQEARRRQVPEPEPSALAHRALKAKLAAATTAADLTAVIEEINDVLPRSRRRSRSRAGSIWRGGKAPTATTPPRPIATAPPTVRQALDRRIWADATARLLELQAAQDLPSALAAAEQAASVLPEKTTLPAQLIEKATTTARQDLAEPAA